MYYLIMVISVLLFFLGVWCRDELIIIGALGLFYAAINRIYNGW